MNRNGHYYFRMAVPAKFTPVLARKELTYSLKTKCYHEAKSRCVRVLPAVHTLFENLDRMKTLTRDEIKLYIGRYAAQSRMFLRIESKTKLRAEHPAEDFFVRIALTEINGGTQNKR